MVSDTLSPPVRSAHLRRREREEKQKKSLGLTKKCSPLRPLRLCGELYLNGV
jgi:hypothetical protein